MSDTIKVSLELTKGGVKNITVTADTAEARDVALERLRRCLPVLEMLESELQSESQV
jgi:hypothetical protein